MTLEELYEAINQQLQTIKTHEEFANVTVEDEDNSDEIVRPSVRVLISDFTTEKANTYGRTHSANPEIFYFSQDDNFSNEENVKMQTILEDLFIDGVWVGETLIEPERLEVQKEPGTLYCKLVGMAHTTYNVEETGEEIETLEFGMEV